MARKNHPVHRQQAIKSTRMDKRGLIALTSTTTLRIVTR